MTAWDLLGVEPTQDLRLIKRAYSVKLKSTRPDDDAEAYQQLREAYDWAQTYARSFVVDSAAPELPMPVADLSPKPADSESTIEAQQLTAEDLVNQCAKRWVESDTAGMLQAWPEIQTLLDELPLAQQHQASLAFARFVLQEPGFPIEILIALTRHFQWGLDFKVSQMLGPELAHALHYHLNSLDVYAAFRPDRNTRHAWALALAKLMDARREMWARLLAVGLDCNTRERVIQAKPGMLHVLGASRAAANSVEGLALFGGRVQGALYALVLGVVLWALRLGGSDVRRFDDLVSVGIAGALMAIVYLHLAEDFKYLSGLWKWLRRGKPLDGVALVPLLMAGLVYADQEFAWMGWMSQSSVFFGCMVCLYFGLWLVSPTDEHPWRIFVLPTFMVLMCGLQGLFAGLDTLVSVSLAFAWTMLGHVALRRYPVQTEAAYEKFIKLGAFQWSWWYVLAFKLIAIVWVLIALIMLPILVFRMATHYRPMYPGMAIIAGVLMACALYPMDSTKGLLGCMLFAVLAIQVLQASAQRWADAGLKRLSL